MCRPEVFLLRLSVKTKKNWRNLKAIATNTAVKVLMTGWRAFRLSEVGCLTLVTNKNKIQLVMVSSLASSYLRFLS